MNPRKPNRLKGHDYSQNGYYYFVTICVKDRVDCFGAVKNGKMVVNTNGKIVSDCWDDLPTHYPHVELDEFIVMPNHVHAIIFMTDRKVVVGDGFKPSPTTSKTSHGLPEIIRGFKTFSSRKINTTTDIRFQWQRSYYDSIIRGNESLERIREYIVNNPSQWNEDPERKGRFETVPYNVKNIMLKV